MKKYLLMAALSALAFPAYADVESFCDAARGGDVAQIKMFLEQGENVNAKNSLGNTALHYAVASGNTDVVKFLLDNGADVNIANDKGWTPAAIAEKKNFGEIVTLFQSEQNNKALSDLVEKSLTVKEVEQKVKDVKDNASEKVEVIQEKTVETISETKDKVADKVTDVKEKVVQTQQKAEDKVAELKDNVKDAIAETKASAQAEAKAAVENVKEAEKKVETAVKEAVTVENPAEVNNEEKTELKEEIKVEEEPKLKEEPKADEQKSSDKIEAKADEQKTEAKQASAPAAAAKPVVKAQPRRLVKPVSAKPAPKFLASNINKAIYVGDEEITYCLYFLGLQTEQHNLALAAEFFAGSTTMNKARFDQIADLAHKYYDNASEVELKHTADICSKIITPQNRDKQNQIIRAMNKAIGY